MTQTTKRILALLMAIAMLFAVTGCGKGDDSSTPSDVVSENEGEDLSSGVSDDDFFADAVTDIEDDVPGITTSTTSQVTSNGTTTNKPSTAQNTNYWKQMLDNMPNFDGKTIQYYNWNAQDEYPGLSNVIKSFTKATGIQVKYVQELYRSYIPKLISMVASDKAPDIMRTHSPSPHMWALSQDLSVSKYKDYSNPVWDQAFMGYHTVNGKIYATNTTSSLFSGPDILFYNRSLISKYNLEDPYKVWKNGNWTLDTFEKMLKDYKKASGNAAIGGNMVEKYLMNIYGVAGEIKFDGTKFVSQLDDSRVINAMQRAADITNKDNLTLSWGLDQFDRGEILFFCGTGVTAKRLNAYASTVKSAGNLGTVPWPVLTKGSKQIAGWGDDGFAIPKGAKNPEVFPYFVFYVTDPNRYDLKTYFADDQAAEVFNYLTSLPTDQRVDGIGFTGYNAREFFGAEILSIGDAYDGATGDQIPSILNANGNASKSRAEEYNKVLATVGK